MTNHSEFSRLIDNCLEAKIILRSGTILYANQSFIDLLGFHTLDEILGEDLFTFIHPSCHNDGLRRRSKVMNGEVVPFQEQKIIDAHGRIIETEVMAAPFIHTGGEILVQALIRDLSVIKKHEEMLRQSEKLALIGELSSGMVHEIRNPLTAMKGFLQLMKSHPKPEYIDIVLQELGQIEEIANELLHFSKPAEHPLTRQNILDIVREVIHFSSVELFKRHIKVDFILEDERDIEIIGCKTQLKQVLLNIIKNSIDAITTDGRIKVQISKDDKNVYIYICDNGVGIPKHHLNRVGNSYFTSKEEGTGLGMMVSFNIIKNHNGSIKFESEENQGTSFTITLPLANKVALAFSP
ncbi:ATP-binding protein [Bacillus sp. SG-1]|uniref:ATP-binding protein n=1 Tax=Bacillus sp. SG-1 TaxID=161544 RepID=UPI0001544E36|nr:ATP-binding protein [Bacillus sp. SG-1]EDL63893.1 KinA [Bacillus sp. SG-1]